MKPRQHIFDTYWRFAAERQAIFYRRSEARPAPWTQDPILGRFKFCNVFRAADRVSQFLIHQVLYSGSESPEDQVFRAIYFRLFNRNQTWRRLEESLGPISLRGFDAEPASKVLTLAIDSGERIFGGAFILCATKAFGHDRKHDNYLALLDQMKSDRLPEKLLKAKSLEAIYSQLRTYPLIGRFMAYQIAIDINYSSYIEFDESSFTVAGPGAVRGIRKCFKNTSGRSSEEIIHWMVENQEHNFQRLGLDFRGLWGRPLQAIDCQGLFCEVDKYCRQAFPELKSNRRRIKAVFKPTNRRINYFFPPKWGLNDTISPVRERNATSSRDPSFSDHSTLDDALPNEGSSQTRDQCEFAWQADPARDDGPFSC